MTAKLVELHPKLDANDLVRGLRNIADDIESGKIEDATMIAVVVGGETQRRDREGVTCNFWWQTHGLGEKATVFATKGLLASALNKFDGTPE